MTREKSCSEDLVSGKAGEGNGDVLSLGTNHIFFLVFLLLKRGSFGLHVSRPLLQMVHERK